MITDGILNKIYKKNLDSEIMNKEELYNYGIYLMNNEKFSQAIKIFYKCIELDFDKILIYECLLYIFLRKKYSKKVVEILNLLKEYTSDKIYNIYLYLVGYSIKIDDEELTKEIKKLRYKDILLIEDDTYKYGDLVVDDLDRVLEVIGDIDNNDKLTVSKRLVIGELIRQSKIKEKKFYNNVLELVRKERYLEIVDVLTKREKQINLNMYYKSILLMIRKIMKRLESGEVLKLTNSFSRNILGAISNNNLDKALLDNSKYLEKNNIKMEDDIQYILLMRLRGLTLLLLNKKQLRKKYKEFEYDKDVENILTSLFSRDIDRAVVLIKEYLIKIGKLEYEYLVLNLMNIDIEKGVRTYVRTSSILLELSRDWYEYNITMYLQEFYSSLEYKDIYMAKRYLNIIKRYSSELDGVISNLEDDLIKSENEYNEKRLQVRVNVLEILRDMKENNKFVSVLDGKCSLDRKVYYREIELIDELMAFPVGEEPKKIVLRLVDTEDKVSSLVYFEIADQYKRAYNEKRYDDCLKIIGELLKNKEYGGYHAEVYAYMGLSYYHIRNYQEAIKYLKIAEDLSRNSKNNRAYDFEYLIDRINMILKNISSEKIYNNDKRFVQFRESDFYDLDNYFGISNMDEIDYCIKEKHMAIGDICENYELNDEEILLLKLIYARDYYYNMMYIEGDKLLLEVEKMKNKSERVKKELIEIRKNKLFYKNRNLVRKK